MMPVIRANLVGQERLLLRNVRAHNQHGLRVVAVIHVAQRRRLAAQRVQQSNDVARPVMVDIVGLQRRPRKLLQQERFFIRDARRTNNASLPAGLELLNNRLQRPRPAHFFQLPVNPHQRRLQPFRMMVEVESVAALHAQELAVQTGAVPVIPANNFVIPNTQRRLAAIGTMRANRADVLHFPRPRLVAIRATGQRAHRADIDTRTALVALKMIPVRRRNFRRNATVHNPQRAHAHAFITDTHAAVAKNTTRPVVEHHRAPLFFRHVLLHFGEAALARAVLEHHVLQFALAALIAHRAVQRMVGQQEFQRGLPGLHHGRRFGPHNHALAHRHHARRHQLRGLLNLHQAHAAGSLQRHAFVVTERRNLDASQLGGVDQ